MPYIRTCSQIGAIELGSKYDVDQAEARLEIPESAATSEAVCLQTNSNLMEQGLVAGSILATGLLGSGAMAADAPDPSVGMYPFKQDGKYTSRPADHG